MAQVLYINLLFISHITQISLDGKNEYPLADSVSSGLMTPASSNAVWNKINGLIKIKRYPFSVTPQAGHWQPTCDLGNVPENSRIIALYPNITTTEILASATVPMLFNGVQVHAFVFSSHGATITGEIVVLYI